MKGRSGSRGGAAGAWGSAKERIDSVTGRENYFSALISAKRTTKVTKGGKTRTAQVVVVHGDCMGSVGVGVGKSGERNRAKQRGLTQAQALMSPVHGIFDGRLAHDVKAKEGATTVQLFAARKGKGIVAGSKVKAVLRAAGVKDCIAKVHGNRNPLNTVRAAIAALHKAIHPQEIALKQGKRLKDVLAQPSL